MPDVRTNPAGIPGLQAGEEVKLSDAFRMLLIRIAREKALPFEPLVPNDKTTATMKEARQGQLPRFQGAEELMADLNAPN